MAEPPIVGIVTSVNGKRGAVSLNAGDINAIPAPPRSGLRSILNNSWATATLRASSWSAIEWSPELEIFVAVAYFGTEPRAVFFRMMAKPGSMQQFHRAWIFVT